MLNKMSVKMVAYKRNIMNKYFKIRVLALTLAVFAAYGCNNSETKTGSNTTSKDSVTATAPVNNDLQQDTERAEQQENQNNNPESEPVPAEEIKQNYTAPAELKYSRQSEEYLFDKFYPIGWSKDGHFAYIVEPADEAAGLYFFEFVIQNMISDKVVYSWKPDDELEEGSVKQMWKDYAMLFAEKLNKYGIIQQKDIKIESTEFSHANNKFKVTIDNQMGPSDFGFDVVKATEIFIKSPDLGSKRIYKYTEKEASYILGEIVAGVIKSPYEDRVAVVVKKESSGYEGPPNVISQFLVGANLTESFKK